MSFFTCNPESIPDPEVRKAVEDGELIIIDEPIKKLKPKEFWKRGLIAKGGCAMPRGLK